MSMHQRRQARRAGLTLIELIVVISILSVLLTLVIVFVIPAFSDNKNVIRGVDRATTALLIAKQRALRDQAPRGVRFLYDPTTFFCSQIQYIEQPDPITGGIATVPANSASVTISGTDLLGGATLGNYDQYLVQGEDYFRYEAGTPSVYRILPNPAGVTPGPSVSTLTLYNPVPFSISTTNYRIIRQSRPIAGEDPMNLPQNVVVDLGSVFNPSTNAPAAQQPYQMPYRTNPSNPALYYYFEVLFDPAGGVTNRPTSTRIALIVRDATADNPFDANTTRVIGINPRTGFISAHPVGPAGNPLQYALDGNSDGL